MPELAVELLRNQAFPRGCKDNSLAESRLLALIARELRERGGSWKFRSPTIILRAAIVMLAQLYERRSTLSCQLLFSAKQNRL